MNERFADEPRICDPAWVAMTPCPKCGAGARENHKRRRPSAGEGDTEGWDAGQWKRNAMYWHERCQQAWRERDANAERLVAAIPREKVEALVEAAYWEGYRAGLVDDEGEWDKSEARAALDAIKEGR